LLVEIAQWRIPKENSKKHLDLWSAALDYQRSHPEKFHYTMSRMFTLTEEGGTDETWMWIDEYENREAYDKMSKAWEEDQELAKYKKEHKAQWDPMRVPDSFKAELWTERLRVDLRKQT
jgi:hypothetical protein